MFSRVLLSFFFSYLCILFFMWLLEVDSFEEKKKPFST